MRMMTIVEIEGGAGCRGGQGARCCAVFEEGAAACSVRPAVRAPSGRRPAAGYA